MSRWHDSVVLGIAAACGPLVLGALGARGQVRRRIALLALYGLSAATVHGQVNTWDHSTNFGWNTGSNWSLNHVPTGAEIARFDAKPTSGTTGIAINMGGTTNNGPANMAVGAIHVGDLRLNNLFIGNNSTTTQGTLTFNGATIDGLANTFVYHNGGTTSAPTTLTFNNTQSGGTLFLNLAFSTSGYLRTRTGSGLTGANYGNTIDINCYTNTAQFLQFLGGGDGTNRGGTLLFNTGGTHTLGAVTVGDAAGVDAGRMVLQGTTTFSGAVTINPYSQLVCNGFSSGNGIVLKSMGSAAASSSAIDPGGLRIAGTINTVVDLQGHSGIHTTSSASITGAITQSGGTWSLTKTGPWDLTLMGACTYGDTNLLEGSITIDNGNNRLPITSNTNIAAGASLILGTSSAARSQQLRSIVGAGSIVGAAAANSTLTISAGSGTFTGLIGGIATNQNRVALTLASGAFLELARPAGSTYVGNTSVNSGSTLRVSNTSGSATGTGNVTVASGSTLEGAGAFTGNLTNNGTVDPGTPTARGTLTVGNAAFNAGSTLTIDLLSMTDYDAVNVVGTVSINATAALMLDIPVDLIPGSSDRFWILRNDGTDAISGAFLGKPHGTEILFAGGVKGTLLYSANFATGALTGGNDVVIAIPAPAAAAHLMLVAVAAVGRRRRHRYP